MNFIRLYARVLKLLGDESRLGWMLAIANVSLAAAQFAEPVLFGRIVDTLAGAQSRGGVPAWTDLVTLLAAWVSFGLFTITCGALVALHADRLAHRRRHAVMTDYFEHILQLPLSFHGGIHSGRLMKVMLTGTDSLWWLWLGFFREHLAAFVSLLVLLPLSLILNWRLALLLIALCVVFAGLTALVLRKAEAGQSAVERHYGDLAERASDALGNVALVQSYSRIEAEVSGLRNVVAKLLGAQMPVLSWWAICAVLTRASTTLTMLSIFVVGIWLNIHGQTTVGEIVTFTSFAGMLIVRLEQAVGFANRLFQDRPRLIEFFEVADTVPSVRDRPDAIDPGRVHGLIEFADVSFSYDGKRAAVADLKFTALPGEIIALVGPTGAGKSTALALLHRVFDPQVGLGQDRRHGHPRPAAFGAAPEHRRGVPGGAAVQPLDRREPARRPAGGDRRGNSRRRREGAGARFHRGQSGGLRRQRRRARADALGRRAPAHLDRAGAREKSADPDPRRGDQRARRHHRDEGAGGARRIDEGAHHLRDRAPAVHRAQRHPHPGVRSRPHRREPAASTNWSSAGGAFAALAKAQFLVAEPAEAAPSRPTRQSRPSHAPSSCRRRTRSPRTPAEEPAT